MKIVWHYHHSNGSDILSRGRECFSEGYVTACRSGVAGRWAAYMISGRHPDHSSSKSKRGTWAPPRS